MSGRLPLWTHSFVELRSSRRRGRKLLAICSPAGTTTYIDTLSTSAVPWLRRKKSTASLDRKRNLIFNRCNTRRTLLLRFQMRDRR